MAFRNCTMLAILSLYMLIVFALPSELSSIQKRCTNSPSDRSCWGDYDINTNYLEDGPDTGNTVEYYWEVVNVTLAPDGIPREMITVNGSFPGPTIEANWGDTVVVHVTNRLQNNGTGIHFHGLRQYYTNQNDGVPSVTQCPLAPGDTMTYRWKATQYGTSFYHSHLGLQAWDGGIVINGPATANYDEDLGVLLVNDWTHYQTSDQLYKSQVLKISFSIQDTGLINGTNIWQGGGKRFELAFQPGKKYLLRLVNVAIDNHFKFSIDNHKMTVIAADFTPIKPFETDVLSINIAERYDVIVEADQPSGDYWLRAVPGLVCVVNLNIGDIRGIVRYDATSTSDPSTDSYFIGPDCDDQSISTTMEPHVPIDAGPESVRGDIPLNIFLNDKNLFKWVLNDTEFNVEWGNPTLTQIWNNDTGWTSESDVIELSAPDEWAYFVIETPFIYTHPIHLHGHDFLILAQGGGTFDDSIPLSTKNPLRRDTAMVPIFGYLVIAFKTDNPGAWLLHCHIGWHVLGGLALQYVERRAEIPAITDFESLNGTCANWNAFQSSSGLMQDEDDSGV